MKTPEEIKCDLMVFLALGRMPHDQHEAMRLALLYIQQLEAERDAAVDDVKSLCATNYFSGDFCAYCKHNEPDGQCHHPCQPYSKKWGWEWRGVLKEE